MIDLFNLPKLSELRATKDLVDIGSSGRASQSSLSRWSRPDDAQNAVMDLDRDFAFHTDAEDAPWWSLTFDQPQALQYLALENRRDVQFRQLADHLVIEVENDERTIELYNAVKNFGTEEDDSALIIPLTSLPLIKRIKIVALTGGGYFHLSKVRVFALRKDNSAFVDKSFLPLIVANRRDGFGERLKAILNAMIVAKNLPGKFRFGWADIWNNMSNWHDVLPAEETFSEVFLKQHLETQENISALDLLPISVLSSTPIRSGATKGYHVTQQSLQRQCPHISVTDSSYTFENCFEDVKFTDHLENARKYAKEIDLGKEESIALHLRAGDLIFGEYRKMGRYHLKACPFPIAQEIAADLQGTNTRLVLFGQDKEFIQYLVDRYEAVSAISIAEAQAFDAMQQALFDISLMARCKEIICGSSGFANLSCWIGGIEPKNPYEYYDKHKTIQLLESAALSHEDNDPRISNLQKSFAIGAAFVFDDRNIAETYHSQRMLDQAIKLDPENGFFWIIKVCSLINMGNFVEADEVLVDCLRPDSTIRLSVLKTITGIHPGSIPVINNQISYLKKAADRGYPMSALCLALCYQSLDNTHEAKRYTEIFSANRDTIQTPLGSLLELLQVS